jgi:hypothetical protein
MSGTLRYDLLISQLHFCISAFVPASLFACDGPTCLFRATDHMVAQLDVSFG